MATAIPTEELVDCCGEPYTMIVKAHVDAEEYRRLYAEVRGYEAPPGEYVRQRWGRWIPVARSQRAGPERMLHPAKPGERGAFPYTENTRDLP